MPKMLVPMSCNPDEIVTRPVRLKRAVSLAFSGDLPAGTCAELMQSDFGNGNYWLQTQSGELLASMSRLAVLRECEFLDTNEVLS
jgi:hypothetical protein